MTTTPRDVLAPPAPPRKGNAGKYQARIIRGLRAAPAEVAPAPEPRDPAAPIIGWDVIDRTLPSAKIFGSVLGWGNSLATNIVDFTALQTAIWLRKNPGATETPFPLLGILMGLAFFIICTGGQIYTIRRMRILRATWLEQQTDEAYAKYIYARRWYLSFLAPDVVASAIPWMLFIFAPMIALFVPMYRGALVNPWWYTAATAYLPAALLGLGVGYFSARGPEKLIFGED